MPAPISPDAVLSRSAGELQGMACVLEAPQTPVRQRRCEAAPTVAPSENAIVTVMGDVTRMLAGGVTPAQQAQAHALLAWSEGLVAQHYRSLFARLAPGRRALTHVQDAMRSDPQSATAASTYAMTLLGLRKSAFRGLVERAIGLDSTAELTRVARSLSGFKDDLKAQTLLGMSVDSLSRDGAVPPDVASAAQGVEQRIAALRARNPRETEEVDDALMDMEQRAKAQK